MKSFLEICLFTVLGCLTLSVSSLAQQAPSEATNIRIATDAQTKRLVINYDLPTIQTNDSLYVEIQTASSGRFRPTSVSGDVGKKLRPGPNKVIYWDVVRDKIQLNEEVEVVIRIVRTIAPNPKQQPLGPITSTPKKSVLPVVGWVVTGGLAIYTFSLASSLNKDVDAYNQNTMANTLTDWNAAEAQRKDIDSRRGTFTVVAGTTAALAVANVVWLIVRKGKKPRTSWHVQPSGQAIQVGFVRKF